MAKQVRALKHWATEVINEGKDPTLEDWPRDIVAKARAGRLGWDPPIEWCQAVNDTAALKQKQAAAKAKAAAKKEKQKPQRKRQNKTQGENPGE